MISSALLNMIPHHVFLMNKRGRRGQEWLFYLSVTIVASDP
jgi:hypothetical protein